MEILRKKDIESSMQMREQCWPCQTAAGADEIQPDHAATQWMVTIDESRFFFALR
jgi:hypothetical protein